MKSHFYEIREMERALNAMKTSLGAFGKFVPKSIVHKLVQSGEGAQVGGRKMDVTILFTDIQGFSALAEKMTSEKLSLHLFEYFDALTTIIIEEGGTVDKYIGDSIMAFWGAPLENPDHPLQACRAMIRCLKKLESLNRSWELDGKPALITRFGIHTGDAVVGNIGSHERLNYSAFGDNVNLASRLEGANKSYHTYNLISYDTYKQVAHAFIARPVDVIRVSGRHEPMVVYELLAEKNDEPRCQLEQEQFLELASLSKKLFQNYGDRQFQEALEICKKILHDFPRDPVAKVFQERCEKFLLTPPPTEWDGVFSTSK
jgi:adenylate cyclase